MIRCIIPLIWFAMSTFTFYVTFSIAPNEDYERMYVIGMIGSIGTLVIGIIETYRALND